MAILIRLMVLCLALGAPLFVHAQTKDDPVIAKMGALEMRSSQIQHLIDALGADARKQLAASPQELDRLLRQLMVRNAVVAEAREKGWDKRPEVVQAVEQAREQALAQSYMNNVARPPATYPSDEEVRALYEASKAQLMAPAEYQLSQIFVAVSDDTDKSAAAAQRKLADLSARLQKAPQDFAKLARELSDNKEVGAKGGDLGWLPEDRLVPELRTAVLKLAKGEISAPIKANGGYHVIRLADRKPSVVRPLPEVHELLSSNLRLRRAQETERSYLEAVMAKTPISVNQIELGRLQGMVK